MTAEIRVTTAAAGAAVPIAVLIAAAWPGGIFGVVLAALAGAPAGLYFRLTAGRPQSRVLTLVLPLAAYVIAYVGAAPSYDTTSTGGVAFFLIPVAGLLAVALSASMASAFGRLRAALRRRP